MAFKVMADNSVSISASQDGAIYDVFAGHQNFIITDVGDEFSISTTDSSLQATIGTGEAIISGRHITAQEDNQITLPASATIYLCLRIDLTQTAGNEGQLIALTTQESMRSDNLNAGGTVCDLLLYTVQTSANGVSSSTDMRAMKNATGGAIYQNMNYTIPSYQNYTSGGNTDIKFYADVTVTGVTTSMVAQPIPDVFSMKSSDMGKCIATDTMNGSVRMYFTAKPTTYVLKAFLLTIAKEEE